MSEVLHDTDQGGGGGRWVWSCWTIEGMLSEGMHDADQGGHVGISLAGRVRVG